MDSDRGRDEQVDTEDLSRPIEYTTPRVSSNVNCELQVIMMCPCRPINCNKCTTLGGC